MNTTSFYTWCSFAGSTTCSAGVVIGTILEVCRYTGTIST